MIDTKKSPEKFKIDLLSPEKYKICSLVKVRNFRISQLVKILQKKIQICLRSPEKGQNWPPEKNQNSGHQKGWVGTLFPPPNACPGSH